MKRFIALIVLLGFVGVFAGCSQENSGTSTPPADTNAAPAAPSTNK